MSNGLSTRGLLSCLCFLTLFLVGCGRSDDSPALGDWTLTTDALRLTEDLCVSETENFYFGAISDLAVTPEGRMLVADREAKNIKILASDGSLVDTLGGPGEGPGEFQHLNDIQVARGDSLYAYDVRRSELTVYAPPVPYERNRIISFPTRVVRVWALEDNFVGLFDTASSFEEGISRDSPTPLRLIPNAKSPDDTLMHIPQPRFAAKNVNQRLRARPIPFSRKSNIAVGPKGRLYHGWSDSLHIQTRSLNGTSQTVINVSPPAVPVRKQERDALLKEVHPEFRNLVASAMPETKPAFTDLIVSDDGRLWVRRPAQGATSNTVAWWILDPETKTIHEVQLPVDADLEVVQKGNAYGTTTTERGAPAVVRYTLRS